MKKALGFALVLLVAGSVQARWQQVFVPLPEKGALQDVQRVLGGLDHCGTVFSEAGVEFPATEEDVSALYRAGLSPQVLVDDLEEFYAERLGYSRNYGAYHTYSEGMAEIQQLHDDFPDIVGTPFVIGLSLEGNDIWALKISDNPEIDEEEPEVFYNAYIHAREAITIEVLLHFMHHLTDNYGTDQRVTDIVDGRELWFVPFMNPDGVLYNEATNPGGGGMWRKNRRNNGDGSWGVDLNRNYGYMWGYDDSGSSPYGSSETYRGTGPFSEPASQVIRDFTNAHEFTASLTYHSYSNLYIYPWGYDNIYTPDHDTFVSIADQLSQFNGYAPGTAWELLYPVNGDTDDWFYGDDAIHPAIFALTPEVGSGSDGFWPSESRIEPLVEENLEPNLLFAEMAGNPWGTLPPAAPTLDELGEVGADYVLTWSTPDPDPQNPAVDYELREMTGLIEGEDDFADADNWVDGSNPFTLSGSRYVSAPYSFYGGEQNSTNAISTLAENISVESGDAITFQTWYDIEVDYDYAYVEISTNGGGSWSTLQGNITTTYDPNGNNDGHGINGNSGGWIAADFPLDGYVGQSVSVRLRYETDTYVLEEGFYVDDFAPVNTFASEIVLDDHIAAESYAVNGQSPGDYWYKVRARDAEDDLSGWSNVIHVISTGGEDLTPPVVSHTGLPDTQDGEGPWTVNAEITDASGVASADLEYRVNAGGWTVIPMAPTRDTWTADIPGPVAWGSTVEYQITATDASANSNTGTTGPWSFEILAPSGLEYCQDFEGGLDDFTVETYIPAGNSWTTSTHSGQGTTAYIQYSASGQEDHSALISPVFDCSGQATMELGFWHHLKMGWTGAWTDAYLRGSVDGGANWPYLLGEWHEDDQPGEFEIEGTETLDITSWAAGEAQVRIMFEYHDEYDWWWYVDDVCLTGTLPPPDPDPVVVVISASGADILLDWDAAAGAEIYDVYYSTAAWSGFALLASTVSTEYLHEGVAASGEGFYYVVSRNSTDLVAGDEIQVIDPAHNRRPAPPQDKPVNGAR